MVQTTIEQPTTAALEEQRTDGSLIGVPNRMADQLIRDLEARKARYSDTVRPMSELRLVDTPADDLVIQHGKDDFKVGPRAFASICSRLKATKTDRGLPAWFLLTLQPEERTAIVNRAMAKKKSKTLLRLEGNRIRAALSENYTTIDNLPLATRIAENLPADAKMKYELNDEKLTVQITTSDSTDKSGIVSMNDIVSLGYGFSNSEVGAGSAEFFEYVYRMVCTNGMISQVRDQKARFVHMGGNDFEAFKYLHELTSTIGQRASELVRKFRDTNKIEIDNPETAIENTRLRFKLTGPLRTGITEAFDEEPGNRVYNVINAVTRAANNGSLNLAQRTKLQTVGGRLANEISFDWMNAAILN